MNLVQHKAARLMSLEAARCQKNWKSGCSGIWGLRPKITEHTRDEGPSPKQAGKTGEAGNWLLKVVILIVLMWKTELKPALSQFLELRDTVKESCSHRITLKSNRPLVQSFVWWPHIWSVPTVPSKSLKQRRQRRIWFYRLPCWLWIVYKLSYLALLRLMHFCMCSGTEIKAYRKMVTCKNQLINKKQEDTHYLPPESNSSWAGIWTYQCVCIWHRIQFRNSRYLTQLNGFEFLFCVSCFSTFFLCVHPSISLRAS